MNQRESAVIVSSQLTRETTVIEIQPSKEFKQFVRWFIQDLHLLGNTLEEIIDRIVKDYDESKRSNLRISIDIILESKLTHQEMQRIWSATDSDIYFKTAEGFRDFLRRTRDRL
jgi:hypothetical protein